ncbi:MAG TPA: hypothetical protein VLA71_04015 [Algoriphagus sp.]|nr:hypothetical protein [Algoriphagus sp.]
MKSSLKQATHSELPRYLSGCHARFFRIKFGTGFVAHQNQTFAT